MIQLSPTATTEILRLRAKTQNPKLMLRVSILSSGCLDRSYALSFDDVSRLDDQVYDRNHLPIVVNAETLPYVRGLVIDYSEDLMGGSFRFHNPNSVQACSCGNSFSVVENPS